MAGPETTKPKQLDHRDLRGKGLNFFDLDLGAGEGLPFWYPEAARVRCLIEDFWRSEHYKRGYEIVFTPHIGLSELWKQSGHEQYFLDKMYAPTQPNPLLAEEAEYRIRPMNCPFHILMYKSLERRHDELPIRYAELGTVYRFEQPGKLVGLLCVRGFTQDDAHIFCRQDQVADEVVNILRFAIDLLSVFGFREEHYELKLSTEPKGPAIAHSKWRWAQGILKDAAQQAQEGCKLEIAPGRSLFYGPKLDVEIKDSKGHSWICSTIQIDLFLAEQFSLSYHNQSKLERPVIIHRTLLGSLERFFALLIEHHKGALPAWLSPIQVIIIPVSERKHIAYGQKVKDELDKAGLRTKLDKRTETLDRKICDAHAAKIPYALIIGDKEMRTSTISPRLRSGEDLGACTVQEFIRIIKEVIEGKHLTLLPSEHIGGGAIYNG